MPILLIPSSSSSFQLGLRAVIRASEKRIASVAVPVLFPVPTTARTFPTSRHFSSFPKPCDRSSTRAITRPSIAVYNAKSPSLIPQVHLRTIFSFRAITHYTDLPDWYEDAKGLPFRKEDLNQREANKIFPSNLFAPQANLLLRIIHGRRVAGTLDDPTLAVNTRQFRIQDQKKALEYLREHIPVDEVLNAGLRAEDELRLIEEEEIAAREAQDALRRQQEEKAREGGEVVKKKLVRPTGRLPKKPGSDSPYGVSNFDLIRAENVAKRKAEEARLEEERKLKEEELAKGNIGTLQTEQEKPKELSPFRKKYIERAMSDLEAPPEMTALQRLWPSLAMATLVVFGSMTFAYFYQAPMASARLWPDIPPAAATCIALIGLNLAVYALWKFPPAWAVLNKYMILVAATPRPLQILGAIFSHHSLGHLAANMTFLWFFGTRIHDEIGRGNFLALYLSCGAIGFAASLAHLVLWRGLVYTTLGASGAVYGLVTAFFWMHKFDEFKVLNFPPDPISGPQGLGFLGLIVGLHLVPILLRRVSNIDNASHFGGMFAGAAGVDLARKHMDYKARVRAERLKSMGVGPATVETRKISSPPVVEVPTSSLAK